MGREWVSLPGNQLLFSVVLHPRMEPEDFPLLSLLGGVAVAEAIEAALGLCPRLKWPNDVLLDGRKVCGILVEGRPGPGNRPRMVMGIGVNCLGRPEDYPQHLGNRIDTLAHATGQPVETEPMLQAILARLEDRHRRLDGGDKAGLLEAWSRRALLQGQRVRMATPQGELEAAPLGVTAEGYLLVESDAGERFVQVSGELTWLNLDDG